MAYLAALWRVVVLIAGVCVVLAALWAVLRRPARYVYRHLFGEPFGAWTRAQVDTVVVERLLKRNGGTTVPDVVASLAVLDSKVERNHQETVSNHRDNSRRLDAIEQKLEDAAEKAAVVAENLATHDEGDKP